MSARPNMLGPQEEREAFENHFKKILARHCSNEILYHHAPKGTPMKFFATRTEAWQFMRECDEKGLRAGFPSLTNNGGKGYSVEHDAREGEEVAF